MNKDLIKKATQALRVEAVFLRNAQISLREGLDPLSLEWPVRAVPQYRAAPVKPWRVITGGDSMQPGEQAVVTFFFDAGVRLVNEDHLAELEGTGSDAANPAVFLEITGEFASRYQLAPEASLDELDGALTEFAEYNAGFHIWPYWREFVQSTCARMGIPPIPIPMYQVPSCDEK